MLNIFSKQRSNDDGGDVYKYDQWPEPLKLKIIYIFRDLAGYYSVVSSAIANRFYSLIRKRVCEKYGRIQLIDNSLVAEEDFCNFFLREEDAEMCVAMIQIVFECFQQIGNSNTHIHFDWYNHFAQANKKLNICFQEHSIGYEFRNGQIIRIDSSLIHKEVVTPAMMLLREKYLAGANQEFLKAHEHFRHARYAECINECLKSFESTMKAICHKQGWQYKQTDTAKTLLEICEQNKLFPTFMQSSLSGLRSVLESVQTVRNKMSAHGRGIQEIEVTEEVAAFVIHSTGANILFLVSLEKKLF